MTFWPNKMYLSLTKVEAQMNFPNNFHICNICIVTFTRKSARQEIVFLKDHAEPLKTLVVALDSDSAVWWLIINQNEK